LRELVRGSGIREAFYTDLSNEEKTRVVRQIELLRKEDLKR